MMGGLMHVQILSEAFFLTTSVRVPI